MAIVKSKVIGSVSGKLGDLVFRQMNGKTFVSVRPKKYKSTKSTRAKNVRNGFKEINKFASTVNKDEIIKKIWMQSNAKGRSAYTKIIKANLDISKDGINASNIFLPNKLKINSTISLHKKKLQTTYFSKDLNNYYNSQNNIFNYTLLYIYENNIEANFLLLRNDKPFFEDNNITYTHNLDLTKKQALLYAFSSIVILKENNAMEWSSNNSKDFNL